MGVKNVALSVTDFLDTYSSVERQFKNKKHFDIYIHILKKCHLEGEL